MSLGYNEKLRASIMDPINKRAIPHGNGTPTSVI